MKVIADHREAASGVVREIHRLEIEVEVQQLDVGDFILSERVGIERKTVSDFLDSIVDGRLMEQARNMAETFESPILILEGEGLYTERAIHPNAIRGALASIAVDYGISIICTEDEKDTASMIKSIINREDGEEGKSEIPIRSGRKALTIPELQQFVVEGLPGVSAVLAKRLLEHFDAVENIMMASKEKLKEVHGIGDEKAKEIRKVLKSKYESSEEDEQSKLGGDF